MPEHLKCVSFIPQNSSRIRNMTIVGDCRALRKLPHGPVQLTVTRPQHNYKGVQSYASEKEAGEVIGTWVLLMPQNFINSSFLLGCHRLKN